MGRADTVSMPAESMTHLLTAEELERVELPGKSTELFRGRLIVREPPSTHHGAIAGKVAYLLGSHVYRNKLGLICGQDTGFRIESDPDTVRAPDVAFLSRQQAEQIRPTGYAQLAPDLAVEIVSPSDRTGELLTKVGQWLDAGSKLVWVIDPARARAVVYRANGDVMVISADGQLEGEDVLPGFRCGLAEVLE
jgi:Uma2 family endonuclease